MMTVTGCSHRGIASTGLKAPDSVARGGFTKKLVNKACCADLLKVAMTVPMYLFYYAVQPMPGAVVMKQIGFDVLGAVLLGVLTALLNRPPKAS